jgi:hypothetical protein
MMENNASSVLQSIDSSTLTPIVRQALRRDAFQILDWRTRQLGGGMGNPVSVGLYRFEGTGQDQAERMAWSVILKIIQSPANVGATNMGEGDDQTHWNYWKRELLVYPSGLLETLPEGLAAPRCFGVRELPGNLAWLWLEDIVDVEEGAWSLERYARIARLLGRFNGRYVSSHPLPDFAWLSRHPIRQWIDLLIRLDFPWDHPRVLDRYPKPEVNPFRRMLLEHERFLTKLDLLPRTLRHGDTYPTNFKARHLNAGGEQIVALDWALIGIETLGDDLGQFVLGAHMNLKDSRLEDVDAALFESYVDGLKESGCRLDPQWVRFAYTTLAALRVGLFQLYLLNEELQQSQAPAQPAVEHPDPPICFEVAMAKEAYGLLDRLPGTYP